jgi:DNA-binding NarL/FixJ family response regulator
MSTTVVIVDDHAPFRSLARSLLQGQGYTVIGEANDGASAVSEVRRLHPELVLLDIQLPDTDGFEVARQLAAEGNRAAIVLISSRDASEYRRRLAETTARGFIAKSDLSGDALSAILADP